MMKPILLQTVQLNLSIGWSKQLQQGNLSSGSIFRKPLASDSVRFIDFVDFGIKGLLSCLLIFLILKKSIQRVSNIVNLLKQIYSNLMEFKEFSYYNFMESNKSEENQTDSQIRGLLKGIHNTTIQMSNTFQQAILRHEQQFIKTYRTKITELSKLFQELTKVIEDKFINNALTSRLDIVMKERDYFKYECLKLNVQYQTLQGEQNSLNAQFTNVIEQMNIYKHLLEDEKLKNNSLESNIQKIKANFANIAYKSLSQTTQSFKGVTNKIKQKQESGNTIEKMKKKLQITSQQLKQKSQNNRNLKLKISDLEIQLRKGNCQTWEHHDLYEIFKVCVDAWKRNILTKERRNQSSQSRIITHTDKVNCWNLEKLSVSNKKELLKYLFTTNQFLQFIEKLLFSPDYEVSFNYKKSNNQQGYIKSNRKKLYEFMKKRRIINAPLFTKCQ